MSRCIRCGEQNQSQHYKSGKMKLCKNCQRYSNLVSNSNVKRKRCRSPLVLVTEPEFATWVRSKPKVCFYCGISEEQLERIDIKSNIGLRVESLGVDRLDSSGDYSLGNIELCCFVCNRVKSAVFTSEEMGLIGAKIGEVWLARMSKAEFANGRKTLYDGGLSENQGVGDGQSHTDSGPAQPS